MNFTLLLSPAANRLFKRLDSLAASGCFDRKLLDEINSTAAPTHRVNAYYIASLYLQLGEEAAAHKILSGFKASSREMKKFFHVLLFSVRSDLPYPTLSSSERRCLEYLDGVLEGDSGEFVQCLDSDGGFSIVGNAPGDATIKIHGLCSYYFNSYRSNDRITDSASIHVVTPSFNNSVIEQSNVLCITGNNIFHRRSSVWRKFINTQRFSRIYTVPRAVWGELFEELGGSPSAGLLMLFYVAGFARDNPQRYKGHIAGFSNGQSRVNHSYDTEPASERHNWPLEAVIFKRLVSDLQKNCHDLKIED